MLVARRPSGRTPDRIRRRSIITSIRSSRGACIPARARRPVSRAKPQAIARGIAEAAQLEGILAVEMFLLRDGRLLVNELAPRPHNSYHASELACPTSQFEQLVRAVCDLPLGGAEPTRPAAIVNLFGDLWEGERLPRLRRGARRPRLPPLPLREAWRASRAQDGSPRRDRWHGGGGTRDGSGRPPTVSDGSCEVAAPALPRLQA